MLVVAMFWVFWRGDSGGGRDGGEAMILGAA